MSKTTTETPPEPTPPTTAPASQTATQSRPPTKRKYRFRIGQMDFERRSTATEIAAAYTASPGIKITLLIDGLEFQYSPQTTAPKEGTSNEAE